MKSSLSGGMRNGFLLSPSALGWCVVVDVVVVAGMGGRGACFVKLEREPGVLSSCRDMATPTVDTRWREKNEDR